MKPIYLCLLVVLLFRVPRMLRTLSMAMKNYLVIDGSTIHVTDGDSITIAGNMRCRVVGYDSPEWDQPQGPAAKAALRAIITGPTIVVPTGGDAYGRMLVHVFSSHGLASWRMVQRGHAYADSWWLIPTMFVARLRGRGMWGTRGLMRPSTWRMLTKPYGQKRN